MSPRFIRVPFGSPNSVAQSLKLRNVNSNVEVPWKFLGLTEFGGRASVLLVRSLEDDVMAAIASDESGGIGVLLEAALC